MQLYQSRDQAPFEHNNREFYVLQLMASNILFVLCLIDDKLQKKTWKNAFQQEVVPTYCASIRGMGNAIKLYVQKNRVFHFAWILIFSKDQFVFH